MGLNKEINDEIKAAFDTDLADAVKDFTGERITPSDDDWLLNGTSTPTTEKYSGRGVFSGYNAIETDGQTITQNDVKLICLQSEVDKKPELDDIINGYQVMAVSADPADVSWTVQLRKT